MLRLIALFLPLVTAQEDCLNGTDITACKCFPTYLCANVAEFGAAVAVNTSLGPIIGRTDSNGVSRFFGVPTAADAGLHRFKPPQPFTWDDPKETVEENICALWNYPILGTEDCIGVDVMTLNSTNDLAVGLWVHGGGFFTENPFFVFLEWGPLQSAAFAQHNYDLPNGGLQTTILAHYRLGALGWMAHPGFIPTDQSGPFWATFPEADYPGVAAGNFGMMDVLNHMKWISDDTNAAAFGYDKSKVTVFGESAGGAHTTMLMASPLAQGLAQTFIAESPFISYGPATFSAVARTEMDTLYVARTGCGGTNYSYDVPLIGSATAIAEADCLRTSATVLQLIADGIAFSGSAFGGLASSTIAVAGWNAAYGYTNGEAAIFLGNSVHIFPIVDGVTLTLAPLQAYSSGINSHATMLVGHNTDEYFTFCLNPLFPSETQSALDLGFICEAPDLANSAWILGMYYLPLSASVTEIISAVLNAAEGAKYNKLQLASEGGGGYYDWAIDHVRTRTVQVQTDAWFANGNDQVLEALLAAPSRPADTVYHYVFAEDTDPELVQPGACHGCELTYVLGFWLIGSSYLAAQDPAFAQNFGVIPEASTDRSTSVGRAMNYYWASLMYYGKPNPSGSTYPEWSAMTLTEKNTMHFSGDYSTLNSAGAGAAMNPCVRYTSCRTEQGKDWRYAQKQFWSSAPADTGVADKHCDAAPTGFFSKLELAQLNITCTFLPCCTYSSARKPLFGMPSSGGDAPCDPIC